MKACLTELEHRSEAIYSVTSGYWEVWNRIEGGRGMGSWTNRLLFQSNHQPERRVEFLKSMASKSNRPQYEQMDEK